MVAMQVMKGLHLEWHTRHGAPHNLRDLDRVNAGHARTVILLEPEEGEASPVSGFRVSGFGI